MSDQDETLEDALVRAESFVRAGELEAAADLLARVGLDHRAKVLPVLIPVLERLALEENGLRFRYVPGGTFRQGYDLGEPDERPAHDVTVRGFWMTEVPVSWAAAWRLFEWPAPPSSPDVEDLRNAGFDAKGDGFGITNDDKIRRQYCESKTQRARDWHAHVPEGRWTDAKKGSVTNEELFGKVPRYDPSAAWTYDQKPIVAVDWHFANRIAWCAKAPPGYTVRLPTESEWERAARGLFREADYPWGDAPPDGTRADYDRFDQFSMQPSHAFAPNDFGLFAMAGSVWEWCLDEYDACFYEGSPSVDPLCKLSKEVIEKLPRAWRSEDPMVPHVVRGGSWSDDAAVLRVSFRNGQTHGGNPNTGVRLVRARSR